MVQRRQELRFALEPREAVRIVCDEIGQNLERDVTTEFRVAGSVDLTL
jgi:hypothetical protein